MKQKSYWLIAIVGTCLGLFCLSSVLVKACLGDNNGTVESAVPLINRQEFLHLDGDLPAFHFEKVGFTRIKETGYFDKKEDAIAVLTSQGHNEIPARTFGLPGDAIADFDKWLVESVTMRQHKDLYITETIYKFNPGG